jgi:ribonuclease HI
VGKLDKAAAKHDIEWIWVKGHAGHIVQEVADDIARKTAELGRVDDDFMEEAVLDIGVTEI